MALISKKTDDNENIMEGKSCLLTDYDYYTMSSNERILAILMAAVAIYAVGFVFYRSHIICLLLTPFSLLYPKIRTKEIIKKRKNELNLQFKDMLYSLSSSLSAGRSIERSFEDVLKDLEVMYPDPETFILVEVMIITRKISLNETVEEAMDDLATRSHLEDIKSFVDVFQTAKRTSGNIVEIIRNTSNIINDKIEIRQEIDTMMTEKKFEQKIMNLMPIFLVLFVSVSAADFMEPVFTTVIGRIVMTVAVLMIIAAYFISKKIMDIKV